MYRVQGYIGLLGFVLFSRFKYGGSGCERVYELRLLHRK